MKNTKEETHKKRILPVASEKASEVVKINFAHLKEGLSDLVRGTVEETLNGLLETEAEQICKVGKYERSAKRKAYRSGSYTRKLHTQAGAVNLKVPKLSRATFETQIIERYRRREASVEESLVQMYLAGVSVRRVEDITEGLWGSRVSPSTMSRLNNKIYERIEHWRQRPLQSRYVYGMLDGIWLKRCWGGEMKNVSVLVAIGVNEEGYREVIGVCEGKTEDKASWKGLLQNLYQRGLKKMDMIISDKSQGLLETLPEVYPDARWQRCVFHFHQNILNEVPRNKRIKVAAMLQAIHSMESAKAAKKKAAEVAEQLKEMKLPQAAHILETGIGESLTYHHFPREHHRCIRTNNLLERMIKEIRRRTRVVGSFPDGKSALMLVCARLRYIASNAWSQNRPYLDMSKIKDSQNEQVA